jgi:maltose O-acetyltransferase
MLASLSSRGVAAIRVAASIVGCLPHQASGRASFASGNLVALPQSGRYPLASGRAAHTNAGIGLPDRLARPAQSRPHEADIPMKYIGYAFYYLVISHLPHSRFSMLFNRIRVWYLCRVLKVLGGGEKTYVEHHVFIGGPGRVTFGRSCQINQNTFIEEAEIGNCVMIAPNVAIISSLHNHDRVDIPMVFQGETTGRKVIIEDDVWLGRNVLVMPGLTIGKGSIVAAGSVVTKDVAPYAVVGGVPARFIRDRRG